MLSSSSFPSLRVPCSLPPAALAPQPAQQCPDRHCSGGLLALPAPGCCLCLCPFLSCSLKTKSAAPAARMPHPVPACLTWEQVEGILACSCLFRRHKDSLCTFPDLLLSSSPAVSPVPVTVAVGEPLPGTAVPPADTRHGVGSPALGHCCTNCWTAQTHRGGQGLLWAVTEWFFSQSQPHPAAGPSPPTTGRPCASSSFLLLTFLAWMWLSVVLPKSLPREVVSVLVRKSLPPCDSTCGMNAASLCLPTEHWLTHQLFNPTAHPKNTAPCMKCKGRTTSSKSCWVSPSVSQDQALPEEPEGFTLLLSWLSPSYCPSNAALLALFAVFRCFSQMMSLLSPAASVIFSIFYSRYLELLL